MTSTKRRELLVASAISVGLVGVSTARAQTAVTFKPIAPKDVGALHSQKLFDARKRLGSSTVLDQNGLTILVDYLVSLKVITEDDAKNVKDLISLLAKQLRANQLVSEVEKVYASIVGKLSEVAAALFEIARSSAKYVAEVLSNLSPTQVANVVASDIAGAMTGAATAAQLGGGRAGAVIGVLVGGASASINAASTAGK